MLSIHTPRLLHPVGLFALVFALCVSSAPCFAQAKADPEEPPKPRIETFSTQDGVNLKGTYYPGLLGKDTVPIVLLHMWGGSRADWREIPEQLQKQGHAVLNLDLRGHGESTTVVGAVAQLDYKKMPPKHYVRMYEDDMESVKTWLLTENNAGKVNIEKLCVIGAEMGAVVAVNWAARDWSWPELPGGKQGQDVKALVLISPEWNFKGITINQSINSPALLKIISMDIVVGEKDAEAMSAAKRLHQLLVPHRPSDFKDRAEADKLQDLFLGKFPIGLQGTKMLTVKNLGMDVRLQKFIKLRLVDKTFPWKERTNPLEK